MAKSNCGCLHNQSTNPNIAQTAKQTASAIRWLLLCREFLATAMTKTENDINRVYITAGKSDAHV
jgi:hypothetical protein